MPTNTAAILQNTAFPQPVQPPQPKPVAGVQQPLISLMGTVIPQPPPLTGNVDPTKIEEIRRTVYVGNLNSNVRILCCLEISWRVLIGTWKSKCISLQFTRLLF